MTRIFPIDRHMLQTMKMGVQEKVHSHSEELKGMKPPHPLWIPPTKEAKGISLDTAGNENRALYPVGKGQDFVPSGLLQLSALIKFNDVRHSRNHSPLVAL
ncbi:MAG: hypothetical protein ACE5F6_02340 [Anaerolineae bacterium]